MSVCAGVSVCTNGDVGGYLESLKDVEKRESVCVHVARWLVEGRERALRGRHGQGEGGFDLRGSDSDR